MAKKSIKALVAVRSGAVRVQNKNIRPFCGTTLLELRVKQLLEIPELDGVVVNSNDPIMLEMAADLGASTVQRDGCCRFPDRKRRTLRRLVCCTQPDCLT